MRLALIADIHGNLPSLEAVLDDVDREGVNEIVCLGDVALGPLPVETVERLRAVGCPVVMGNWDAWFFQPMPTLDGDLGRVLGDLRNWSGAQLSEEDRRYVLAFEATVEVPLGAGATLLGFHGSPRSFQDMILATTPDAEIEQMLDGRQALVLAGGHTHFQLFRRFEESAIVNPGSVGLPFRRGHAGVMPISPWAEYGIVDYENGRLGIELRRTPYDVESFLSLMLRSGMPHAEWWAELWTDEARPAAVLS
jgi:predicted phosphodiesterase